MRFSISKIFKSETGVFICLWILYLSLPFLQGNFSEHGGIGTTAVYFVFGAVHVGMTVINNYGLIPRYFYQDRYLSYLISVIILLSLFGIIEEGMLEKTFYPTSRGATFGLTDILASWLELGTILFLFGAYKLVWDHQKKQKKIDRLEKEKAESELRFLKSQINPHVFFNNLNTIYSFALDHSEKLSAMILKLSELMRYMLYECNDRYVRFDKELGYLQDYVELQRIRLEERGQITFNVEGDPGTYYIAPLLLITFVENSFKHSMQTIPGTVKIKIEIIISNGTLIFSVINNHMEREQNEDDNGIGLKNVRKRLELLYPGEHELNITRSSNSFEVKLKLRLLYHEDTMHHN